MTEAATALATIAGVVLLGSASPGPNFVAVSASALVSRSNGLWTAAGVATASLTWAILGVTGLAFLVSGSGVVQSVLRWVGAAYLIYLGVKILAGLRRSPAPASVTVASAPGGLQAWTRGYLVNMANPKTAAFVASFFLSALPAAAPAWLYAAAAGVAGAVSLTWYGLVALLLSQERVSHAYLRVRTWIDLALATALLVLGLRLALA